MPAAGPGQARNQQLPPFLISPTRQNCPVRICVIFNPTARGDKARHFRRHLDTIGAECALKQTAAAGAARTLAAGAVREGFEIIVAAGGDGTLNEVLNGIGDVPGGFDQACLGILPLGTVNVFAKELRLPLRLAPAWQVVRDARETRVDVLRVNCLLKGAPTRHYFVQMAGAGLDARAIELVNYKLKKRLGPLAYIWAGIGALGEPQPRITVTAGAQQADGCWVLVGNGRFYGGKYVFFPTADLRDGLLDVRVFPRIDLPGVLRSLGMLTLGTALPAAVAHNWQAREITLTSPTPVPLEVDGELMGHLPATFTLEPQRLRVLIP